MSKVRNFAELAPNIGFSEFDFYDLYRSTFEKSELGRMKKLLPLHAMAENFGLVSKSMRPKLGRKSYFTPEGKVALMFLKMYTGLSCPKLMEQLNGNIHYQMFCDVIIDPTRPLTNYKLLDDIMLELAGKLKIQQLQDILAKQWKPYMQNLDTMYTDATCYESEMRYPADPKLLWEGIEIHCLKMHKRLFGVEAKKVGGDTGYAGTDNRDYCKENGIQTSFVKRGRPFSEEKNEKDLVRKELARVRATAMEGSFGTQKEHYDLRRVKARTKLTEILYIFFGIHTANVVQLADRIEQRAELEVA